jgi:hydrogenase expression/formation protein HypC
MCREWVARVARVDADGTATVDVAGRLHRVSLAVLDVEGVPVAPDDWVIVHTGLAIERLTPAAAAALRRDQHEATGRIRDDEPPDQ